MPVAFDIVSAYLLIFSLNQSYTLIIHFLRDFLTLTATANPIMIPISGLDNKLAVIIKDPIPTNPLRVPVLNLFLFLFCV